MPQAHPSQFEPPDPGDARERSGAIVYWAKLLEQHQGTCLLVAILLTLLMSAWLPGLRFDTSPNATFVSDNQVSRDLDRLHATFGPDDNDIVVMLTGESLLEPASLTAMRTLRDQVRAIPQVESVSSILDLNKPGRITPLIPRYVADSFTSAQLLRDLTNHPLASNQMVSNDGSVVVMLVRMRGESLAVASIASVLEKIRQQSREFEIATSSQVRMAGHPAIRADVLVTLQQAMLIGCTAAVIVSFLVALMLFQRLAPVLVAVSAPAIGCIWTFGLIAWAGADVGGLLTALPNLVFVVGLTDAVHVVLEYQRQLRMGKTQRGSVVQSLLDVGPACFLTSLTTFIGFGSLALSKTASVQQFGFWAAIGTTLALFAVVFTLPIILLGVPVEWMKDRHTQHDRLRSLVTRLVSPTLRRPGLTTAVAVCLTLLLLYPALAQQPDIIWTEAIPDDSSSVVAMQQADASIGGALAAYVMITWPEDESFPSQSILAAAAQTQALLRDSPEFNAEFSILNLLAVAPGQGIHEKYRIINQASTNKLDRVLRTKNRSLLVSARVPNDGAFALNQRLRFVERRLDDLADQFPGFEFTLTGTVVAASKNMNAIIVDLARSLAIAAALIFVVLTIAFRSLTIGCLSVIPNVLPLLVAASSLHLLGLPLQITAAVTFSLCLGLAVDDTIHVLMRFRAVQVHEPNPLRAMEQALSQVGPALVVTTLILLGGFVALSTSPLPSIRLFSILSAAILVAALVGDLVLFPAMLVFGTRKPKQPGEMESQEVASG